MKQYLQQLIDNQGFTTIQAKSTLLRIGTGEVNPSQIAAFLGIYAMKGVTVEELEGFRAAMLELAVPIDLNDFDAIDIVGTGGDGKNTFNISTTAAFVVAGAGQPVAKHGNHGVSSSVGSSTVLEYLGVKFTNDEKALQHKMEQANICFLHAPLFHPAMKYVAPIRKELGVKTFFNILGPLLNPAKVRKQLLGVYNLQVMSLYAELMNRTDIQFGIIHALDGYDEISLTGDFKLITPNETLPRKSLIDEVFSPQLFDYQPIEQEELSGGATLEDSARILINVLKNEATVAQKNVVVANAAIALRVAQNLTLAEALSKATDSLESGKAYNCFKKLIEP